MRVFLRYLHVFGSFQEECGRLDFRLRLPGPELLSPLGLRLRFRRPEAALRLWARVPELRRVRIWMGREEQGTVPPCPSPASHPSVDSGGGGRKRQREGRKPGGSPRGGVGETCLGPGALRLQPLPAKAVPLTLCSANVHRVDKPRREWTSLAVRARPGSVSGRPRGTRSLRPPHFPPLESQTLRSGRGLTSSGLAAPAAAGPWGRRLSVPRGALRLAAALLDAETPSSVPARPRPAWRGQTSAPSHGLCKGVHSRGRRQAGPGSARPSEPWTPGCPPCSPASLGPGARGSPCVVPGLRGRVQTLVLLAKDFRHTRGSRRDENIYILAGRGSCQCFGGNVEWLFPLGSDGCVC